MPAPPPDRAPVSTYRLQLNQAFPFESAARIVPYLEKLGVTDCYTSPILRATPGSTHCYDICDHSVINPELGGSEGAATFAAALRSRNLGWILDFVPNHMGIDVATNSWWRDVLANGPSSPYARYFDIDWEPLKNELRGKILLPILGDQYGITLDRGELRLEYNLSDFHLCYFEKNLPLNPRQLRIVLRHNLEALQQEFDSPEETELVEFRSILFHLDHVPAYTETDRLSVEDRRREMDVAMGRLNRLAEESPRIRAHIEDNVRRFNGVPGESASFDLLHELLEAQPYRLSFWRTAMHEINYRRFFDINELAGIRMEDDAVFLAAHSVVCGLIQRGDVTGIRLDHVDGLFDPAGYFARLQEYCGPHKPYIVVEKILSEGEGLRADWTIHGTTGYEFLNQLNSVFVDPHNAREFYRIYARFARAKKIFEDVAYTSKQLIIDTSMASELNVLADELNRISERDRHSRDFTLDSLREALVEVVACFPVYRTYVTGEGWDEFDERNVDAAVNGALRRNPAMEPSIFHFIRSMLLPCRTAGMPPEDFERRVRFARKFQQYTGPVQAKGVEDTAFYRYGPLLSLNEVGGHPSRFGRPPAEFHRANEERRSGWPLSMLATSSHDTKRGEDARARLNALSEMPQQWSELVSRCGRLNASARTIVRGEPAPSRSDEYLYYQTLVAAWPVPEPEAPDAAFAARIRQYMNKATKEKKTRTSWINPSREYDDAVASFVDATLTGTRAEAFLRLFLPFQKSVARFGAVNSLAQLVLKLASPGVPDFYQGTELWDLSLVDPDNRREVDFDRRERQLDALMPMLEGSNAPLAEAVADLLEHWQDGRIKQYVTAAGLRLRRRIPRLFLEGAYQPLYAKGKRNNHVVAFARTFERTTLLAIAPRLSVTLSSPDRWLPLGKDAWADTEISLPSNGFAQNYRNVLTGQWVRPLPGSRLSVAEALSLCPAAILIAGDDI